MDKKKFTLDYSCTMSESKPDEIVIVIKGTGIDLTKEAHKKVMDILIGTVGTHMYAHANHVDFRNVILENVLPLKDGN